MAKELLIEINGIVKHISFDYNVNYVLKGNSLATCNKCGVLLHKLAPSFSNNVNY